MNQPSNSSAPDNPLSSASLPSPDNLPAPSDNQPPAHSLSPTDLVLSSATLGFPLPSEQIPLAAKYGFSAICVRTAEWKAERQRGTTNQQLRQMIADAGLVAADIDCLAPILGSGEPAPEFFGATQDDVFACAEGLRARSVNLVLQKNSSESAPKTKAEMMEAAAHDCARMAARAAEIGMLIHLEPVPFMDIKDAVMALEIIAQVGHPNLGIQVDSWHHLRGPLAGAPKTQVTAASMLAACETLAQLDGSKILAVQICDSGPQQGHPFEDTMKRRLLPGEGEFPLAEFVSALRQAGCRAPVSVEVFADAQTPEQQDHTARKAAAQTRAILEAAGSFSGG